MICLAYGSREDNGAGRFCSGAIRPLPFTHADVIRKKIDRLSGTIRMVKGSVVHHRVAAEPASPFPKGHSSSAPLE